MSTASGSGPSTAPPAPARRSSESILSGGMEFDNSSRRSAQNSHERPHSRALSEASSLARCGRRSAGAGPLSLSPPRGRQERAGFGGELAVTSLRAWLEVPLRPSERKTMSYSVGAYAVDLG